MPWRATSSRPGCAKRPTSIPWAGCTPLFRLLAGGQPFGIEGLADAAGRPVDDIRQTVASLPDVELDDHGRIVGYGLTLRETPHRFEVEGKRLYTWCALDTLVFPALLGRSARIESPCHGTGTTVRVTVEPTGVTNVDPETAVVSIVAPDKPDSIRGTFCSHVHFFASSEAAQNWLDEHPAGTIHAVDEALRLGQPLIEALLENIATQAVAKCADRAWGRQLSTGILGPAVALAVRVWSPSPLPVRRGGGSWSRARRRSLGGDGRCRTRVGSARPARD